MFRLCQVCAKALRAPETLGEAVSNNRDRHGRLSHAAVLLPGLVHHGGVRRVQGRGEGAQETSQQRQAQSAPSAEHGPAVTVADVLRYPEHVAGVAGEFEIDASHARAQGDYAARPCQSKAQARHQQQETISISSGASFPGSTPPPCGDHRHRALRKPHLTSHEEEKSGDILHQIMLLTAAQHAYDPPEQDDGYGHAYETGGHPFEICRDNTSVFIGPGLNPTGDIWGERTHGVRATRPVLLSSSD